MVLGSDRLVSVIAVSLSLPSDSLSQHPQSYFCFSYLGRGVSLHGCPSKAQPLPLTLDEGYPLTAAPPDLGRGVAPLGPPVSQPLPSEVGELLSPRSCAVSAWRSPLYPWPWARGSSSRPLFFRTLDNLLPTSIPGGASLVPQMVKPACGAGDQGAIPGSGRSPGEGNGDPLQYFCLEKPMDGGAWRATVHGVMKSWDRTERLHYHPPRWRQC